MEPPATGVPLRDAYHGYVLPYITLWPFLSAVAVARQKFAFQSLHVHAVGVIIDLRNGGCGLCRTACLGHQFLAPGTTVILDSPCSWDRRAPDLSSRDQKKRRRPMGAVLLPHPVREGTPAVLSQRA